jgi:hypothetical protein
MTTAHEPDEIEIEDTRTRQIRYFDPHHEPFDPRRNGLMRPLTDLFKCEAIYPFQKTRAPSPCWGGST